MILERCSPMLTTYIKIESKKNMKIITKIKDYYDYVGKIYGEDDKITYNRLDLTKDEYHDFKVKTTIPKSAQKLENIRTYIQGKHIHQLIICGFVYTVEKETYTNEPYKLVSPEFLEKIREESNLRSFYESKDVKHYYNGEFLEEAKTFCKLVGQPVIVYTGRDHDDNLSFSRRIPNLGEAGISTEYSPEQMFQMIQQFISNEIRENPDTQPPVEVEDKYKIIGHGFDLKTSFRHRKEV